MIDLLLLASSAPGEASKGAVIDLLIVLAAAALVTMSLHRVKLSTIPGYLLTGAIIGPSVLGLIRSDANVEDMKGLATVLLMFIIGLHLDIGAIRSGLMSIFGAGIASTLVVTAVLWPLAILGGMTPPAALAVAMALSMSSTAVALRILQQRREMHRLHGRLVVGISIVQDLLSLVVLAVLPLLALWGGTGSGESPIAGGVGALVQKGAVALAGMAVLILFGKFLLPRMLDEAAREQTGESSLVLSSAVALGAAVLAGALGFSPELGAFTAGFMLASTPFRYQLAGQLAPLRDLFMAVFFTTVGLKLNLGSLLESWWLLLLGVPLLIIVKFMAIGGAVWAAGATPAVSLRSGLALANGGEFSLVILGLAEVAGVTTPKIDALAIAIVVLSLIVSPNLFNLGDRLLPLVARLPVAPWLRNSSLREKGAAPAGGETDQPVAQPADGAPTSAPAEAGEHADLNGAAPAKRKAIIAGFGVIGRAVADHLEVHGVPYTIVELNPGTVQNQQKLKRHAVYGDIGNPSVLESAGVEHADAVFLTVPDDDAVLRACRAIRALAPHVHIVARTAYLSSAFQANMAGADDVAIAEVALADAMVKKVLARLTKAGPAPAAAAG
jgi:CPA2 family monovalent cation:H+ antiporter-2